MGGVEGVPHHTVVIVGAGLEAGLRYQVAATGLLGPTSGGRRPLPLAAASISADLGQIDAAQPMLWLPGQHCWRADFVRHPFTTGM